MTHNIENILKNAKKLKLPYPQTFEGLKAAGVRSYEVHLANYDNKYEGIFGEWHELPPRDYVPLTVSDAFSQKAIQDCIHRHQMGKTTFLELIKELAESGVSHYRVNMNKRTVTYYDQEEVNQHQELVPIL